MTGVRAAYPLAGSERDELSELPRHTSLLIRLCSVAPGRLHVELTGEVDLATERDLEALGALLVAVAPRVVTLDLAGVTFVDMGGLRTLTAFEAAMAACDITIRREHASDRLNRLQDLMSALASEPRGSFPPDSDPAVSSRPNRRTRRGRTLRREALSVVLPASDGGSLSPF